MLGEGGRVRPSTGRVRTVELLQPLLTYFHWEPFPGSFGNLVQLPLGAMSSPKNLVSK